MQKTKEDHRPREPGEFPLECLKFVHIRSGGTFGSHETYSYTQAHGRTYGRASHFHEQGFVAGFAENPFVTWFRRFNRLVEGNGIKPDKTPTDGTAYGFVPARALSCFSPGGNYAIIFWYSHFVRSLYFAGALPGFGRKVISPCSRYTTLFSTIIVPYTFVITISV